MKNYVITIIDNKKSIEAADRCIDSGVKQGMLVQNFRAITPRDPIRDILKKQGISDQGFKEKFSRLDNCISAFLSHYALWNQCALGKEEFQIFEHDAIIVNQIPEFIDYKYCISLGKPSYGKYQTPNNIGVNTLTSKRYFPGAHAYRLKPAGARLLIAQAKVLARPTDIFLTLDTFPWLEEYYPWPVEAHDTFSTIQRAEGCLAKHNYSDKYEII
jgi:GR25 family glycosyltransferase involved in LPS biosynthesis